MQDSEKLSMLRTLTRSRDDDATLLSYLGMAKRKMLNRLYPFVNDRTGLEIPERYDDLQIEIAIVLMNKRGVEGEVSHSENGVSRTYGNGDIPNSLLAEITPLCGIPE